MKMKFINVDYKAPMKNPDIDIQSQSDKCVWNGYGLEYWVETSIEYT